MVVIPSGRHEPLSLSEFEDDVEDSVASRTRYPTGLLKRRVLDPVLDISHAIWFKLVSFVLVNAGLLLVAASQAFFALMNVAVKKLNSLDPPVPALELVAVRMGITYICCLSYLLWRKVPDPFLGPKGVRHLLIIRGFSGFFGLFGVYYSLQYLSLSDATVLTFLVPLTTAVSGYLFLGEVFHRREAVAGVLSLLGVVLIARPKAIFGSHSPTTSAVEKVTSGQRLGAVGVALLGVLGATGAYTSMRAIGKRAHTLHSMSYFSLWCVITSAVGMILLHQKFIFPTRLEWLALLVMIGIFGFLAQALLTMGLQRETAGRGALAIYVQIIYATILERIFFHTVPSTLSIIGTLIIMGSAVYVALTKETSSSKVGENTERASSGGGEDGEDEAFDLELGVAEPERQRSRSLPRTLPPQLVHHMSVAGGLAGERDGFKFKSDLSLHHVLDGREGGVEKGEDEVEGAVLDVGDGSETDLDDNDDDDDDRGDNDEGRRLLHTHAHAHGS